MKNIHLLPTDKSSRLSIKDGILILHRLQWRKGTHHIYITTNDEEIKEGDCILLPNNEIIVLPTGLSQVPLNNFIRGYSLSDCKKITLTTNVDLIKDGVQAIEDDFLEWFVKNPSCERVEVESKVTKDGVWTDLKGYVELPTTHSIIHKIIIPKEEPCTCTDECLGYLTKTCKRIKEEPKQEKLEEANKIEKIAMDILKSKWEHLYTFGYPQKPFPTNYKNELNNIKIGLYEGAKWQQEQDKKLYSEEDLDAFRKFMIQEQNFSKSCLDVFVEQFKNK